MSPELPVGALLRDWRRRQRLSQLDLSILAGVSSRHISFLETGRTAPSRQMSLRLAEHLGVPLRERNRLLVAAGFAPVFRERPLEAPDMAAAHVAIERILDGHEPAPALAVDHRWNLVLANTAAEIFWEGAAPELLEPPINIMRLGLHPGGFAPRLLNLDQVRQWLLPRLGRQAHRTGDPVLSNLYTELVAYGDPIEPAPPDSAEIALPIRIRHRGAEFHFFSVVTHFGTAFDITLDQIAVEAYFPADEATARALLHNAETRS